MISRSFLLAIACVALTIVEMVPQDKGSRPSPAATASLTLNGNDIVVNYSSPSVKGREIWGKLVPYNEVWRTGANENTTISFSKPVKIEGQSLAAGTYGVHTIPTSGEWTVIFSKDYKAWGSYSYKQEDDALRVKVKPQSNDFQERLAFAIQKQNDNSANVVLTWEKLKLAFKVDNTN